MAYRSTLRLADLADAVALDLTRSIPGTVSYRDAIALAIAESLARAESKPKPNSLAVDRP